MVRRGSAAVHLHLRISLSLSRFVPTYQDRSGDREGEVSSFRTKNVQRDPAGAPWLRRSIANAGGRLAHTPSGWGKSSYPAASSQTLSASWRASPRGQDSR
jgi:hypothetical protein